MSDKKEELIKKLEDESSEIAIKILMNEVDILEIQKLFIEISKKSIQ